jgi:pyridoxine 5-phosphate synthase
VITLSVNLNKIALLRNSRDGGKPSVVDAARQAIAQGAGGITVHPRPDQRHIRPDDVYALADLLAKDYPGIDFNIEGNPFAGPTDAGYPGFRHLVEVAKPHQVTLVPDSDDQLTSDHGWDLAAPQPALEEAIATYRAMGCRVSLFMDPVTMQMPTAKTIGADRVEFYTGPYAQTFWTHGEDDAQTEDCFAQFCQAAESALAAGLGINAGHDLDQENLALFAMLPGLQEVSIGHAIMCEALQAGYEPTIKRYVEILQQ